MSIMYMIDVCGISLGLH